MAVAYGKILSSVFRKKTQSHQREIQQNPCHPMSLQPDYPNKVNRNLINESERKDDEEDQDENEEEKGRLSAGFSRTFTVFMSLVIILTMGLLMFSNTKDGAYVQVQVTPIFPHSNDCDNNNDNVSPMWTCQTSSLRYTLYVDGDTW